MASYLDVNLPKRINYRCVKVSCARTYPNKTCVVQTLDRNCVPLLLFYVAVNFVNMNSVKRTFEVR